MKIAWVTDSTVSLDEDLLRNEDLYVIPLHVLLSGKEYRDGIDLAPSELFALMKTKGAVPTTSQPSIGTFVNLYNDLKERYDCIICFHVSSALSGTYSASLQASQMVEARIHVIDSLILTYPMAALIKTAMKMAGEGMDINDIIDRIDSIKESNHTYVLIGSLEQLHRSGRMSGSQYYIGNMLNIKPIISIENGRLIVKEKVRSEKRAKQKILSYLQADMEKHLIKEIYILYGLHKEESDSFREEVSRMYPELSVSSYPLGTTIGVHAGEKTIGISWFNHMY
ncbi:DegV family protein with EDD domain [Peribacillus deserti]|uniref:DegV family protein with EDD domain n=1 Tax=Peribacillus deserti TaxID=673318 RepID=A0ABS2QHD5_9BACI|nr:DegV family protein [Peribacillus deserti]MBM7692559.1 DegV family protein with EDD domain [Peribacillus deserti]